MNPWRRLNRCRWYARWPVKIGVLAVTVFFVLYPYPQYFFRNLQRWRNPNAMVEPDADPIPAWTDEVRGTLEPDLQPPQVLSRVEKFVYRKVPYKYDWETWGVSDYLPSVAEIASMGYEDCDGRAVVAASILRRLGYRADLVTDFSHVWVRTDRGETMNPGRPPTVVAADEGFRIDWSKFTNLIPAAVYGLAPFPLGRELIVLAVVWLLLLTPGISRHTAVLGLVCLVNGLLFMRIGGENWKEPVRWVQQVGMANLVGAVVLLGVAGTLARRRLSAAQVRPDGPAAA